MKPLIVDLPYPSMDGIEKNEFASDIISGLYAGRHGELTAVLQYIYQSFYFLGSDEETAEFLISLALAEMEHIKILGKLLLVLGRAPEYSATNGFFDEYYSTKFVGYGRTKEKMFLDDLSGEMIAVEDYGRAERRISDEKIGAILKRIALDEELHIKYLKEFLRKSAGKDATGG